MLDPGAILPGRGVYLHGDIRCLRSPKVQRALPGLRGSVEDLLREIAARSLGGGTAPGVVSSRAKNGKNAFVFLRNETETLRGEKAIVELCELLGIRQKKASSHSTETQKRNPTGKKVIRL